ncbi:hypothetical protein Lal_00008197 [Lupinus albus]|nr:hypothetical protein Lal_00008197 [Lupinus albus]
MGNNPTGHINTLSVPPINLKSWAPLLWKRKELVPQLRFHYHIIVRQIGSNQASFSYDKLTKTKHAQLATKEPSDVSKKIIYVAKNPAKSSITLIKQLAKSEM